MKIVCISDVHGRQKKLTKMLRGQMPDGDVLICSGDLTPNGQINDLSAFLNWFTKQPYLYKVFIAGNHDRCFENQDRCLALETVKEFSERTDGRRNGKTIYLQDQAVKIAGVKFYGSPWQPEFCNWAFNLPRGEALKEKWDMIPDDTDVLITHGPPFGFFDVSAYSQEHHGCKDLRDRVLNHVKPKVHVYGHFHLESGMMEKWGIKFINATSCNEAYLQMIL
jgi:Icc-related predicted phosphoesterase